MTDAKRKAAERLRKRNAGFIQRYIWIKPEHWERVKQFVKKITKET